VIEFENQSIDFFENKIFIKLNFKNN